MDAEAALEYLLLSMHQHNITIEDAAKRFSKSMNVPMEALEPAIDLFKKEAAKAAILNDPPGTGVGGVVAELKTAPWYSGPQEGDADWTRVRSRFVHLGMEDVIEDVNDASTKVVAQLANPAIPGLKKRGLVIGYVQSGKTANFTSVVAKAADCGYRLIIVLSGTFENLRRQTQIRLEQDLLDDTWSTLTKPEEDFAGHVQGAALLGNNVRTLMVVKKNASRLRRLAAWLEAIPEDIRRKVPILLLDDEADQATPNSPRRATEITAINKCVRKIWKQILTGTYVGYTATPFANVFMNPNDEEEMYPSDFILSLPRPDAYFGAERLFGREALDEDDEQSDGLDLIREVTDDEATTLKPPSKREDRMDFDPPLPDSLVDAIRWFVMATAIRWARGQRTKHSSMLIHTTQYIDPHFAMQRRVQKLLSAWAASLPDEDADFEKLWIEEHLRASEVATKEMPGWPKIAPLLNEVLTSLRVIVDNGASDDRLDYNRTDDDGKPMAETVIAIGGGTLSRGLTLDGLVVSYFTRGSNTYDTLLQMGRWFGYRVGYEDLPRIWMTKGLKEDFRFLAAVEQEIRNDITHLEVEGVTPRQLGLRVRAHPGRLEIVARNRMHFVNQVQVTYAGQRHQTIWLDESDTDVIGKNRSAVQGFVTGALADGPAVQVGSRQRWRLPKVTASSVADFLSEYRFHPNQQRINSERMTAWINQFAPDSEWNVIVVGSSSKPKKDGVPHDLGSSDVGLPFEVPNNNRAPLIEPPVGTASIKSLLSHEDWFADLDPSAVALEPEATRKSDPASIRRRLAPETGLILILPISRHSIPQGVALKAKDHHPSRRDMEAPEDLVGVGVIFPEVGANGLAGTGDFFAVVPDWEPEVLEEEDDDLPLDDGLGETTS
jgi:hypothetical protein